MVTGREIRSDATAILMAGCDFTSQRSNTSGLMKMADPAPRAINPDQ